MKKVEKFFDINIMLMMVYTALETVREEEKVELVYDIEPTVPKELRGDVNSVTQLLTQLLSFIFHNTDTHEIVLKLQAPDDFLYQEHIDFKVEHTGISKHKAESFFDARLKTFLDRLDAVAYYKEIDTSMIVSVPFKLNELGNRRHYRLPDIGMLGKKVLLISNSKIVAESLRKMFKYFLYEVDVGADEYKRHGSNLAVYDIFVLDSELLTPGIESLVQKAKKEYDLKFVLLQSADKHDTIKQELVSAYLIKPVMQESIFELITTLYSEDVKERKIKPEVGKPIINMEKYIDDAFKRSQETYDHMQQIKQEILHERMEQEAQKTISGNTPKKAIEHDEPILNCHAGAKAAEKKGESYQKWLKDFVETFEGSDRYFREIGKHKAVWQIKEFAADLEKHAAKIGAKQMESLAKKISLLVVYENFDLMPAYIGKYHLALTKLLAEIQACQKKHHF